tara:strand:+ start:674 stop:883 length:210 start_codon:yes stop_codon:yes gene_type:complete
MMKGGTMVLKEAVIKRLQGKIAEAEFVMKSIEDKSVAVGSHNFELIDDYEKALQMKCEYTDMLESLQNK